MPGFKRFKIRSLDTPPQTSPRPEHAADYTGKRRGRMTAIYWYRPSLSGNPTVWVCRCDCGLYEYRRPGTWDSKPFPGDQCELCQRTEEMLRGPNSKQTARQRLQQWMHDLRNLGLSDEEITQLQAPGMNVETKDKTAAQIREQIAKGPQ